MSDENADSGTSPDGSKHLQDSPLLLNGEKSSEEGFRSSNSSPLLDTAPLPTSDDPICPYCAKPFRKPRVLDCLHSMCEDCIIAQIGDGEAARNASSLTDCVLEHTSQSRPTPPGMIRCSVCCQESHVGNDERFVNQMLLDYIRLHNNDNAKDKARSCRACKSEQPAVAVCKECSSDLCRNCVQAHRDMKLFDGHHVYSYDELTAKSFELPREPVTCVKHTLIPCTILCATCEFLICQYCQPEHADGHSLVNVDERVGKLVKEELIKAANSAALKSKEGEETCSSIPKQLQALADQYDSVVNTIDDLFSDISRAVDEVKTRVMKDLDSERDSSEKKLEDYSKRFHATIAKIADAVAFTNRLVEQGTELEVLASRKKVLQQLTLLMHSMPDMNCTIQLSFERPAYKNIVNDLYKIAGHVARQDALNTVKSEAFVNQTRDSGSRLFKQLPSTIPSFSEQSSSTRLTPSESCFSRLSNASMIGSKPTTPSIKPTASSAFSAYVSGPGTIGMERRQKSGTLSGNNSSGDFLNGWPPSSLPPELSTPSPPSDFTGNQSAVNSGASSVYNWPPSSNPPLVAEAGAIIRPITSPMPNSAIPSNLLAQQLATKMNNVLGVQTPNNVWPTSQPAAVGVQLPGSSFGGSLRQRQSFPSLCDPMTDAGSCRVLPNNVFDSLGSGLGRQSQCVTPSEQIPMAQNILHERQLMPLGMVSAWRTSASKNNAAASDLHLRWQIGGLGSGPGQFNTPHGFCLGLDDEILVADTNNHRIQVLSKANKALVSFGISGSEEGHLFYPKKVVAYRAYYNQGYIVVDKGEAKARLQLFSRNGEFIRRIGAPYIDYVAAITVNESGQVVIFSSGSMMFVLDVEQEPASVLKWADCSKCLSEPSDVAVYERLYYVTDYKQHRVVVFNIEGEMIRLFGSIETTPYPIGIDISKEGDVLVADSHGNHFHILAFSKSGQKVQDFECTQIKVSRCVGVRITSEGWIVSLSKQNHNVLLFDTVYLEHLRHWAQPFGVPEL